MCFSFSYEHPYNIVYHGLSLQNTVVCIVTQTSNFRGKEKTMIFPVLAHACCDESGEGEGCAWIMIEGTLLSKHEPFG